MLLKALFIYSILFVPALTGCAMNQVDTTWREPGPLGKNITAFQPPVNPQKSIGNTINQKEIIEVLTLPKALSLALMRNPQLAAISWEVRAKEARKLQAGFLPNPELEIEAESFCGNKELEGTDGMENAFLLSQLFELAGKRSKRVRVAGLEKELSDWDYEAKRLDVFTETTKAFMEVLVAQKNLSLAEETHNLTKKMFKVVSERVKAGKESPLEETKARVSLSSSLIEMERSRRRSETAKKRLKASWGGVGINFKHVEGDLESVRDIPPLERLLTRIEQNPDLARWKTEVELSKANLKLEEALQIPDVTVSGGMQRFNENDGYAYIAGLSIPIPFFDRNQGGTLEARYGYLKTVEGRRAMKIAIRTDLDETYQDLSASYMEVVNLKSHVLPAAREAFDVAREGYKKGKFAYLEVLDAQRTLFEAKAQYIDSLAAYHMARADTERLIGQGLENTFVKTDIPEEKNEKK